MILVILLIATALLFDLYDWLWSYQLQGPAMSNLLLRQCGGEDSPVQCSGLLAKATCECHTVFVELISRYHLAQSTNHSEETVRSADRRGQYHSRIAVIKYIFNGFATQLNFSISDSNVKHMTHNSRLSRPFSSVRPYNRYGIKLSARFSKPSTRSSYMSETCLSFVHGYYPALGLHSITCF